MTATTDLPSAASAEVTTLLRSLASADGGVATRSRLAELLYDDLRELARRQLRGAQAHTLQPTALVHEAWLRIVGANGEFADRAHFLGTAAKAMRCVLVDHQRRKHADKRGGDRQRSSLDDVVLALENGELDLLDLDQALGELEREDPALARLVELRFFSGMTHAEIAGIEGCSLSTVERGWRVARAFLYSRLVGGAVC